MKRYTFADLGASGPEHIASQLIPGKRIVHGGLSFHTPGMRTHSEGEHRHEDEEVFCIMQGRGQIEIDGRFEPIQAGDVLVIEPGEEHHIIGHPDHPIINCWFHATAEGHPKQYPAD